MVPVPEMVAFGERFGFEFVAHAIGDANRSARVERPFDYIENNFLAGRRFEILRGPQRAGARLVRQGQCDAQASSSRQPRELFAVEHTRMKPLPIVVPEVYELHHRIVDTEGIRQCPAQSLLGPLRAHRTRCRSARE